ncbi:MAG TPA: hypothetical protein DGG94_02360 [Micromonosporaceae bacterium]|nr:hypothetical protein [Micromonosporaceae bacterium]HCU48663.1 hypothetical protein [Micromonosporaceae bacterium]
MIVEMILTPRQTQAIDDLERLWRARESTRRWDDSNETCERLLTWLRDQGHRTNPQTQPADPSSSGVHSAADTRPAPDP